MFVWADLVYFYLPKLARVSLIVSIRDRATERSRPLYRNENASTSPLTAVTYPASDTTPFVVTVLAWRFPSAGVFRIRRERVSESPPTGSDAWSQGPQGDLCA